KAIDIVFAHSKVLPELKRMAGAASEAEVLEKTGVRLLISTRGEKGVSAWLRADGEVQHFDQPSSRPKPLVDTAGAGDALIGYFLAQLAQRTSTEIRDVVNDQKTVEEILQDSQRWAAFKCGCVGARGHFAGPAGSTGSWDLVRG